MGSEHKLDETLSGAIDKIVVLVRLLDASLSVKIVLPQLAQIALKRAFLVRVSFWAVFLSDRI